MGNKEKSVNVDDLKLTVYKAEFVNTKTGKTIRLDYNNRNDPKSIVEPLNYRLVGICKTVSIPSKEEIVSVRKSLGLTQEQAACLVNVCERSWKRYETGRKIDLSAWELFLIKTGMIGVNNGFVKS